MAKQKYQYDHAFSNTMSTTLAIGYSYTKWANGHGLEKPVKEDDDEPVMYLRGKDGKTIYRVRVIAEKLVTSDT